MSPRSIGAALALGLLALPTLLSTPISAHDGTTNGVAIEVNDRRVLLAGPVPFEDLGYRDTTGDGLIGSSELRAQDAQVGSKLVSIVRDRVRLRVDGVSVEIIGAGVPGLGPEAAAGVSRYVTLTLASGPHDGDVASVALEWTFDGPTNEVVLSSVNRAFAGRFAHGEISFALGWWPSTRSFFLLGIDHIRYGLDHLLFLVVSALAVAGVSVTRQHSWRAIKLVTAFTVGHAFSLCLAYFDLVTVPANVVEPMISLSIVAAALMAIRGGDSEVRPLVAVGIGLIHGLGFASSLGSIGVVTAQRAPALAAFNLGIDVAQSVVIGSVLVGLWALGKLLKARLAWFRIAAAGSAAVVGFAWTVDRCIAWTR